MNSIQKTMGSIADPPHDEIDPVRILGDSLSTDILSTTLFLNEALPGLMLNEPTALLLDINNFFKRSRECDFVIDYGKLHQIFASRCNLRYCGAFTAVDRNNQKSTQFVKLLDRRGFKVFTKDIVRYHDEETHAVETKGNMDVDITIEALSLSEAFGHIVIGTCDGDFVPLVKKLREGNFRKVSVLGIKGDTKSGMSESLIRSADNFYDMMVLKDHITYHGSRRDPHYHSS